MQVVIHRGTHQIGGCATEIRTDRTRILIDFGSSLRTPEDVLRIPGLNCGEADFDGVFLTHYRYYKESRAHRPKRSVRRVFCCLYHALGCSMG